MLINIPSYIELETDRAKKTFPIFSILSTCGIQSDENEKTNLIRTLVYCKPAME